MGKYVKYILGMIIVAGLSISVDANEVKFQKRDAKMFFEVLNTENMYLVDHFYAEDVHFKDPVVEFRNREDLKHYYKSAYKSTESVAFEIPNVINQGEDQVVVWVMTMQSKNLNKGKPIIVEGTSHIRYNKEGEAIYHRDYFDMGEMIYSHVPFVRGMIRFVNTRMKKKHDPSFNQND